MSHLEIQSRPARIRPILTMKLPQMDLRLLIMYADDTLFH